MRMDNERAMPTTDQRLLGPADALTAMRIPLAVAFPFSTTVLTRLLILAAAGLSDFFDGIVARRMTPSRAGKILDPIADKVFMLVAFLTVGASGALSWWEVGLVLSRDIAAGLGLLYSVLQRRVTTLSARRGGKWATVGQFLTLMAFAVESPLTRPLAWATVVLVVYAIWDYWRVGIVTMHRPPD